MRDCSMGSFARECLECEHSPEWGSHLGHSRKVHITTHSWIAIDCDPDDFAKDIGLDSGGVHDG